LAEQIQVKYQVEAFDLLFYLLELEEAGEWSPQA
jgi:hypothetical protein